MAPLSVLPGRLRFEAVDLVGNREGSLHVEEMMLSVPGVKEASASHRTGRVLVVFDESVLNRGAIEGHLSGALKAAASLEDAAQPQVRPATAGVSSHRAGAQRAASSSGVGHFVMEMALHAFLPAPLDLLLPTAAAFRR